VFISHKNKLVFIKTRKVGGSSVEKYIRDITDLDVCTGSIVHSIPAINIGPRQTGHLSWNEIVQKFPEVKEYKAFTIERNPWDKCVSQYFFMHSRGKLRGSFANFLQYASSLPRDSYMYKSCPNIAYCKWETLAMDLQRVFQNTEINFDIECFKTYGLKAGLRKDGHYSEMYTDKEIEIVRDLFSFEIEKFGYTFEDKR